MTRTFQEVWLEIHVENVATQSLDRVVERKNMDALSVLDVEALVDVNEITELDAQVVTRDLVDANTAFLNCFVGYAN